MSTAYVAQVIDSERRAIVAEAAATGGVLPLAAVVDIDVLRRVPTRLRSVHPANLEALGDGSFVQITPTLQSRVLWVHTENDGYRDSYRDFLARYYPGYPGELPSDMHVDHLYNRERARAFELKYIRMGLVAGSPNTSHGAGYEKKRTHGVGAKGRDRSIDTVMLMKVFGFRSPPMRGTVTAQMRSFAASLGPLLGVDPAELLQDIANLVDVANFEPAD